MVKSVDRGEPCAGSALGVIRRYQLLRGSRLANAPGALQKRRPQPRGKILGPQGRVSATGRLPRFQNASAGPRSCFRLMSGMEPTGRVPLIRFCKFRSTLRLGPANQASQVMQRRRSEPHLFGDQTAAEKIRLQQQLAVTAHGPERDTLMRKIRQLETASHMDQWLRSPGLQSPE
jgi:hypothetical protein